MSSLSLELFLIGFVAPVLALLLILAIARKLRRDQEEESRRPAAHHRKRVGFDRSAQLDRMNEDVS